MKEKLTELLFAVDCSSVAETQSEESIKAFKKTMNALKKLDGEIRNTTVAFHNSTKVIMDNIPLKKLKPSDYGFDCGNGLGACCMLDASANLMNEAGKRYDSMDESERPSNVIFVICIFGRDNASKAVTYEKLKEMIALQRDVYKWKFYLMTDFTINMEKLGIDEEDTIMIKKSEADWFKRPYAELTEKITKHIS